MVTRCATRRKNSILSYGSQVKWFNQLNKEGSNDYTHSATHKPTIENRQKAEKKNAPTV
jgi:hypothetical protein